MQYIHSDLNTSWIVLTDGGRISIAMLFGYFLSVCNESERFQ